VIARQSSSTEHEVEYFDPSSGCGGSPKLESVHDVAFASAVTTSSRGAMPVRCPSPTTSMVYVPAASGGSVHLADGIPQTPGQARSPFGVHVVADIPTRIFAPLTLT
jgi:hypothetical protein